MSLSLLNIDDDEIIAAIHAKYQYHLKNSKKYKLMLDAYNDVTVNVSPLEKEKISGEVNIKEKQIRNTYKKRVRQTFESVVIDILSDGQPRLIVDLITEYFDKTKISVTQKDFSSKLSIRAKSGEKIKNAKFMDFPIEKRFWWGLSDWFEGALLKPEFVQKVHDKYNSM